MNAMTIKTHVFWNKNFLTSSMKVPLGKEFSNWRTQYKFLQTTAILGPKKPVEVPTNCGKSNRRGLLPSQNQIPMKPSELRRMQRRSTERKEIAKNIAYSIGRKWKIS